MQETKMRIRLANRDVAEEALRKEIRELKKLLAESAQQSQKSLDEVQVNVTRQADMDAAQSHIASLTFELSSLRLQLAGHADVVEQNKQLNAAVMELDKSFANAEKRVRLDKLFSTFLCVFSSGHSSCPQLEAASATQAQFDVLRKSLEAKCATIPKLQQENENLKNKLKESLLVVSEVAKAEQLVKNLVAERDKYQVDAAATNSIRKQIVHLKAQLEASAVALLQSERTVAKLSDEIMVGKLQAALKQKTENFGMSSVEVAKDLLEDVSVWRKKCIKAESELHELKVSIAADARRSFLALAIEPPHQQVALLLK
jgi:hypothetical protein